MSVLQQGDSQGELCVADVCEEGVAVSRGQQGCARRQEGLACKRNRNEGRTWSAELKWNATQIMKLMNNWLDDQKLHE